MWSSSTIPAVEGQPAGADPGRPTGILGGTFDPVHRGHLAAAEQLLTAGLDAVWLMPNAEPPHRREKPVASGAHRLRMVELALADRPGLSACDLEVRRGGRSYTLDTLRELAAAFAGRRFVWLLGADAAMRIRQWYRADALLASGQFLIFNRTSLELSVEALTALGFPRDRTRLVRIDSPAVAARDIRERLGRGQPVDGLVPPAVAEYIRVHGLYRPQQ